MVELSIIIPTLNEEVYLPYLIDSIKKQDYKNYEIIVADNNSKDKTRQIAKKLGCKIVKGGLPGKARNNGAKVANGKYLLFLDADVILPPDSIKDSLTEFKKKDLDIATCEIMPIEENLINKFLYNFSNGFIKTLQIIKPIGYGAFILTKQNIHKKHNGFNEEALIGEDWDYFNKISLNNKFRILKKIKIYVSERRLKKEGRLKACLKFIKSTSYQLMNNDIPTDKKIIDYEFGCFKK